MNPTESFRGQIIRAGDDPETGCPVVLVAVNREDLYRLNLSPLFADCRVTFARPGCLDMLRFPEPLDPEIPAKIAQLKSQEQPS